MDEKQSDVQRFIIQIDRSGERLDMPAIKALFEGIGIELDDDYGLIMINPKLGRYVVRGAAIPEAKVKAERIKGVRFFTDAKGEPV